MAHKNKTNHSPYTARNPDGFKGPLRGQHKKPQTIFSFDEANDRLFDIFKNHDFSFITHAERAQLARFYQLLMETQEKHNFTRLLSLRDIAIKHFIDCWIIGRLTHLQFPLLDVGTGPGFPGIPLKIQFPKEKIILAEGVQKRVEFLKHVRESLKLENLDIVGRNINPYFVIPVNGVITRAVEDISNTLNNVSSCLQTGGCVYFMKGPSVDPEIEAAVKDWSEYYKLEDDISYSLPKTENNRRLVIFKKIKNKEIPDEDDDSNLESQDE